MIYTPKHFQVEHPELAHKIIRHYPFATLISVREQAPIISHLPLLLDLDHKRLLGHMARANPQWRSFRMDTPVTAVFTGPHAYVSPRWYEPQPDNVPTWNYGVVHVHGIPKVLADESNAFRVMQQLVQAHDPEWPLVLGELDRRELLREIVVFEIPLSQVDAKFKLSQNRSPVDAQNVARLLSDQPDQMQRETGELMLRLQSQETGGA